ncbi:hypothetical protein D3C81_1028870 [compost metagenome]
MGAGNGSVVVLSDRVSLLHNSVFAHQPQYKHYTAFKRYMVVVLHKPKQGIMIYDFERSIKPLLRTVVDDDGQVRTIVRDFFNLDDGIKILQNLLRMVENQAEKAKPPTLNEALAALNHMPVRSSVTLCPEGRVIMGGYQPLSDGGPVTTNNPPRRR